MAELILKHDTTTGLAVLTSDWGKGANPGIPGHDIGCNYNQAAANTLYVGVATERVVKQLVSLCSWFARKESTSSTGDLLFTLG